jgi:hypothetical protein
VKCSAERWTALQRATEFRTQRALKTSGERRTVHYYGGVHSGGLRGAHSGARAEAIPLPKCRMIRPNSLMTRKEKEERVHRQDGKAFEAFNLEICTTWLNPKYTLSEQATTVISSTGLLKIFELNPSGGRPSFTARWDGGSRDEGRIEKYDLDIDIGGVSDEEQRRFQNGQGGYSGHHTINVESNDKGHAYQVSLRTPDEMIFEGTAYLNLLRKQGFETSLKPTAALEIKVIRADTAGPAR